MLEAEEKVVPDRLGMLETQEKVVPDRLRIREAEEKVVPDRSPAQVSVEWVLRCRTRFGETAAVCGSVPQLGGWDATRSYRLEHREQCTESGEDIWDGTLALPADQAFEYKLVIRQDGCGARVIWEDGYDRQALLRVDCPAHVVVASTWERVHVRFSIHYPTRAGEQLRITGDPEVLGGWFRPGPVPMQLGSDHEELETGGRGQRWTLATQLPLRTGRFQYRYVVADDATGEVRWEREPNRVGDTAQAVNGVLVCRDANFVAGLDFDAVPPGMYLGPYPQSEEDIDALHGKGVTAVLNLQTDEDFQHRHVRWQRLLQYYQERGMHAIRSPIRDFDGAALRHGLRQAVQKLAGALDGGHQVYVHCTAGMGRAPATVVAYLLWCCGLSLPDALAHVKKCHPVSVPNVGVLQEVLQEPW